MCLSGDLSGIFLMVRRVMGVGEEDPREKVPFLSYHFTGTHYTRLLPGGLGRHPGLDPAAVL